MSIDLSFMKDPEWIKNREQQWEVLSKELKVGMAKKQINVLQKYFLMGLPPKNLDDMYKVCYIDFFPLQTMQGHAFCYAKYLADVQQSEIEHSLLPNIIICPNSRKDIDFSTKCELFSGYLSDKYTPDLKMPFVVGQESEPRLLPVNVLELVKSFCWSINGWISGQYDSSVHAEFMGYLFSIFPHLDVKYLTYKRPEEAPSGSEYELRRSAKEIRNACHLLNEFMRNVFVQNIKNKNTEDHEKIQCVLNDLKNRFSAMTAPEYPQELIDHWRIISRRKQLYKIYIDVAPENMKNIYSANSIVARSGFHKEILDRFSWFGETVVNKVNKLVTEWGFDSAVSIEEYAENETNQELTLLCTATDEVAFESYLDVLHLCPINSLTVERLRDL